MTRGLKNVLHGGVICLLGTLLFLSSNTSAYDFSVTIPEGEILEVKLFNSDGVAMGNTTSMNVAPSSLSSAGFNEKNVIVSVATSNEWGYNLVMNIPNTNLVSKEDSSSTIPTLTPKDGGYTCTVQTAATCDFTVNHWGYKINTNTTTQTASNYLPIPTTINLNSLDTVTTGDTTSISFGSRINASQTPGTYQSTITFAVTANPDPTPIMQNVSASDLASLTSSNNTVTLKDERDGTKYTIGKLADGNYWMLDNLALDLTDSTVLNNLSKMNTNATTTSIESLQHGARSAGNEYATAGVSNWTSSYSYSAPLVNATNKDTTQSLAMGQSGTGKVGAYYNYCAASAGSYCYGNGTSAGSSATGNASEDICPKGWRMPTGGSSGEYQALLAAYSDNEASFVSALRMPLSGYFLSGAATDRGAYGYAWASTYGDTANMYNLQVRTSSVNSQNNGGRIYGRSVRCLFDIPLTMQNVTSAKLAQLMPTDGSTTTLPDSRDGNVYSIARIGNTYWMTRNLDLPGGTTITPEDSNVTSNYTLPASREIGVGKSFDYDRVYNSGSTTCGENSPCYSYYATRVAVAGSISNPPATATSDICPKGWRLPAPEDYSALLKTYTTAAALVAAPWNGVYAGILDSGNSFSKGGLGFYYLSSTMVRAGNPFDLGMRYSGTGSPGANIISADSAASVRCVRSL